RQALTVPNAAFAGTASATATNTVREVQVRVQSVAGTVYANPAAALSFNQLNGALAWFNAVNPGGWVTWSVSSGVPFVNGNQYLIIARSQNQSGTYTVPYATRTITYDSLAPQTSVVTPVNGSIIKTLASIT